jgi:phosphoribosylformimino-5-aminoimidazole carboxamide ribotide isomerase
MIIYPAIDLRRGRVVRLVAGDPAQETVFSEDPVAAAKQWREGGAEWLHVVNLDGALGEGGLDLRLLSELAAVGLSVQFGGGLRSLKDAQDALNAGAARVILGTMVIEQPELAEEAISRFGTESVAVALDARNGLVATRGWKQQSPWTPGQLGTYFAGMGVRYALYTDISRDGKLSGVNVEGTASLADETGLGVIASGGVSSLDDIRALKRAHAGIVGAVIGKALYSGSLSLAEALRISREADESPGSTTG